MTLNAIPVGGRCRILGIQGEESAVRRAKELGLVPGVLCTVVRKAPFAGPIELATSLAHIGIRVSDELQIDVELLPAHVPEAA